MGNAPSLYYCCCCGQPFETAESANRHSYRKALERLGHFDECGRRLTCYGCWRKFDTFQKFARHYERRPGSPLFRCCGRRRL